MASNNIITQVSQPQTPNTPLTSKGKSKGAKRKWGLFSCCSSRTDDEDTENTSPSVPATNNGNVNAGTTNDHGGTDHWAYLGHPDPGHDLLPPLEARYHGKKCLVVDLDETLVHSSFKPIMNADFIVPIEIEGQIHQVYVLKRPHVDTFLKRIGELYEPVLFTASLSKYADPVTDLLDTGRVFKHRLFREHCVFHKGGYVKDLSRLGRDVSQTIIIDNSPASYIFHPRNAVAIESWFEDKNDRELLNLVPLFENLAVAKEISDVLRH